MAWITWKLQNQSQVIECWWDLAKREPLAITHSDLKETVLPISKHNEELSAKCIAKLWLQHSVRHPRTNTAPSQIWDKGIKWVHKSLLKVGLQNTSNYNLIWRPDTRTIFGFLFLFLIMINSIEFLLLRRHCALGVQRCTYVPEILKYVRGVTKHSNNMRKKHGISSEKWAINSEK